MTGFDKKDAGRRVELVSVRDPYTWMKPGEKGTYVMLNILEDGSQHIIDWDCGSNLMLIEGVDTFKFLDEAEAE